jgi:hypothetical protein
VKNKLRILKTLWMMQKWKTRSLCLGKSHWFSLAGGGLSSEYKGLSKFSPPWKAHILLELIPTLWLALAKEMSARAMCITPKWNRYVTPLHSSLSSLAPVNPEAVHGEWYQMVELLPWSEYDHWSLFADQWRKCGMNMSQHHPKAIVLSPLYLEAICLLQA